ncbi:uncharacterized protein LOC124418515 [Lucilia cuprina]|uniref:uncharacterized protein LOC124418515 n=1 Tax=Lucilia cuprina TaxID=7375 RepID=UPI001F05369C|nr:uncharacterized protein LOC124418515 [Lucilia cuprina]
MSLRQKMWKEISEFWGRSIKRKVLCLFLFFNFLVGIKGADCKHRWKLLRDRFRKELKCMEAPSGSGMSYLQKWRFLQPMLFLKDSLAHRRTRDNACQQHIETN